MRAPFLKGREMKFKVVLLLVIALAAAAVAAAGERDQEAENEFKRIMDELSAKRRTLPMTQLIDLGERLLLDFVEKYPGTEAEGSARITLGQIYYGSKRFGECVKQIESYFGAGYTGRGREDSVARQVLGSAYIAVGRFDDAEKAFSAIAAAGSGADDKTRVMAAQMLERMSILKRLVIGGKAIDFTAEATDGRELSLEQYRGKVVLLDFWATWCAPCRQEMPNVKKVYSDYNGKGFDIIGISMDQSREQFETYISEQDIKWRQVFDGKGWMAELGQKYAVSSIPATFLIDRNGVIRYKDLRGDALEDAVKELVAEK